MSRSRKKPYYTDNGPARKIKKRQANKRVRAAKVVADGNSFKKHLESWDICDFKFYSTDKKAYRK